MTQVVGGECNMCRGRDIKTGKLIQGVLLNFGEENAIPQIIDYSWDAKMDYYVMHRYSVNPDSIRFLPPKEPVLRHTLKNQKNYI